MIVGIWWPRNGSVPLADVSSLSASPPNFISDLFFMLNAFQHLGLNKSINNRDRAEKNVREIKKELRKVEAEKPSWPQGVSR